MNGIAISLYDKFDDLAVLLDIIRENWDDDYFISVCSNHPDAEAKIEPLRGRIDHFEQGAQIRYDDSTRGPRGGHNIHFRIYDSIRRACLGALAEDGVDSIMHTHADAWPLKEVGHQTIIREMYDHNASVAFPSQTHSFVESYPPGSFEDNFLYFDAGEARAAGLFDTPAAGLPPASIHKLLPMICVPKLGWAHLHQYTNGSARMHWDGRKSTHLRNDARPMFYHPEHDQVHIAVEDFPDNLGRALQAHYLQLYDIADGEHVQCLLEEYSLPEDQLFDRLEAYLDSLNSRLRRYGLSVDDFGRDIRSIEKFLEGQGFLRRILYAVRRKSRSTFLYPLVDGGIRTLQRIHDGELIDNRSRFNKYPDQSIQEYYESQMEQEDFPGELQQIFERSFTSD